MVANLNLGGRAMRDTTLNNDERRRSPRRAVDLPAFVTIRGKRVPCRLANVSRSGALIAAPEDLAIGAQVELDLPGTGPVGAKVVRTSASHVALMFPGLVVLAPRLAA